MKSPVMRTQEDLEGLLPHLFYEIKMLLVCDLLLLREGREPRDKNDMEQWAIHNALFEAHTIHARAIYCFFFQGRNRADDAIASDFVPDWVKKRPKVVPILKTVAPRVGREIAHLTYGRLAYTTDEERQWAFAEITKALVNVINLWLAEAPSEVRAVLLRYIEDYAAQSEPQSPGTDE